MIRRGSLGIGLALCAIGVLMAVAPSPSAGLGWLAQWWPVLPLLAGAGSLVGFATRRQPRSPWTGALLVVFGGIALALTMQSGANPLALYGRFWPLLLGLVAVVEILKYYSWRPDMGELRPALFSSAKLVVVALVVVSGIGANRLAEANPNFLARISMPAGLDRVRDQLFGDVFAFEAIRQTAPLPAGGIVAVTNRFGDVTVEAYDGADVEVALTPSVRAYDRASAELVASQVRLAVAANGQILSVGTNRNEIEHELTTNLHVRVPRSAGLRIEQAHGKVAVAGVATPGGSVTVDASHSRVELREVAAKIEVKTSYDLVSVSDSSGSLSIAGRNDVRVARFTGPVRLEDSDSVQLKDLTSATVDLVSVDHATVTIENVAAGQQAARVVVEGTRTRVTLRSIQGDAVVRTTHDEVTVSDLTGALEVETSHAEVVVSNVASVRVKTDHDDVRVKGVGGPVEIENDHGDVTVSDFRGACVVRTSFDDVRLEAAAAQAGDVTVENKHGKIDLRLPVGGGYRFETQVDRGKVRIDDAFDPDLASDGAGRRVVLKTTNDDIVVRALSGRSEG